MVSHKCTVMWLLTHASTCIFACALSPIHLITVGDWETNWLNRDHQATISCKTFWKLEVTYRGSGRVSDVKCSRRARGCWGSWAGEEDSNSCYRWRVSVRPRCLSFFLVFVKISDRGSDSYYDIGSGLGLKRKKMTNLSFCTSVHSSLQSFWPNNLPACSCKQYGDEVSVEGHWIMQ